MASRSILPLTAPPLFSFVQPLYQERFVRGRTDGLMASRSILPLTAPPLDLFCPAHAIGGWVIGCISNVRGRYDSLGIGNTSFEFASDDENSSISDYVFNEVTMSGGIENLEIKFKR
jgi:hypothetical protein